MTCNTSRCSNIPSHLSPRTPLYKKEYSMASLLDSEFGILQTDRIFHFSPPIGECTYLKCGLQFARIKIIIYITTSLVNYTMKLG